MSLRKIQPDNVEFFTVAATPRIDYVSSSAGSTGAFSFADNGSRLRKYNGVVSPFVDSTLDESTYQTAFEELKNAASTNLTNHVNNVLSQISYLPSLTSDTAVEINRFRPGVELNETFLKKRVIRETLCPWHVVSSPCYQWGVSNYHELDFRSSLLTAATASIMYPILSASNTGGIGFGDIIPDTDFSLRFQVNPRITSGTYNAGVIAHMSSTFMVSLVSGSTKDETGNPTKFRILAQLSSSADIAPDVVTPGSGAGIYSFLSDEVLDVGEWHDVVFRWSATNNQSSASIVVDGVLAGEYGMGLSTMRPSLNTKNPPYVLSVGNRLVGTNSGVNAHSRFFAFDVGQREGVGVLDGTTGVSAPTTFSFSNYLNADIHALELHHKYISLEEISASYNSGKVIEASNTSGTLKAKIGPRFRNESPLRKFYGSSGGVPTTPFSTVDATTDQPFNSELSFGVDGFYVNLENFLQDEKRKIYPRLYNFDLVVSPGYSGPATANEFLYAQPSVMARNSILKPCDDGGYRVDLSSITLNGGSFVDAYGSPDPGTIFLHNMMTGSLYAGSDFTDDYTANPESPTQKLLTGPTIYKRTGDSSSNEVSIFDVSALYYGSRIRPGSVIISDPSISGSAPNTSIELRDNGFGGLYRSNNTNPDPSSFVGFVMYDEGQIVVLDPTLNFFGKDSYRLQFKGERRIHVTKLDAEISGDQSNTSVNPSYGEAPGNTDLTRPGDQGKYVMVSQVNIHDDEYDIIMKAKLAKPIRKYPGDSITIRLSYDW